MTTEEAAWLRDQIIRQLTACPPEAIARLVSSDPAENVMIQVKATLVTRGEPVSIVLAIMHAENAPTSEGVPLPAEHYADVERRGGSFD